MVVAATKVPAQTSRPNVGRSTYVLPNGSFGHSQRRHHGGLAPNAATDASYV